MPSTEQGPMTVNDLVNDLKLLPAKMRIQVTNSDGTFYIDDLIVLDDCTVSLVLKPIP